MGNVLYHPCSGQPKVNNPRKPGPKKGCVSLESARRDRCDMKHAAEDAMKPLRPVCSEFEGMALYFDNAIYFLELVKKNMDLFRDGAEARNGVEE